jgi:hypothetical protein
MPSTQRRKIIGIIGALSIPLMVLPAISASASHFRASVAGFSISGDIATWTLKSAWADNDTDYIGTDNVGDTQNIDLLTSIADAPGSGADTGTTVSLLSYTTDVSLKLFDTATEVYRGDLSGLTDGVYEIYVENCCRIDGISNYPDDSEGDFSQWVRFTKTGSTYNVSPTFSNATLYSPLPTTGTVTLDYRATDPQGGAITYALVTDVSEPYFGATVLPCSTFSGGRLTIGASLCAGGDVYSDIYLPNTAWAAKVTATDSAGNVAVTDSILVMIGIPEPYIDEGSTIGNGTSVEFDVFADDSAATSFTVVCTGTTDTSDVVSATAATSPVTVRGLTPGETYDCVVSATNSVGTGAASEAYSVGPIELDGVSIETDLVVGSHFDGTSLQLRAENMLAGAAYTLVMHSTPYTIASGLTDETGALDRLVSVLDGACVAGVHRLELTGIDTESAPRVDTVWFELDTDCTILQFSRVGPVTPLTVLAATGPAISPFTVGGALVALLIGAGLLLVIGRRRAKRSH